MSILKTGLLSAAISAAVSSTIVYSEIGQLNHLIEATIGLDSKEYLSEVAAEVDANAVSIKEEQTNSNSNEISFIKARLKALFPKAKIQNIKPINSYLYKASVNGNLVGIDKRGETLFKGQIFDLSNTMVNDMRQAKVHLLSNKKVTSSATTEHQLVGDTRQSAERNNSDRIDRYQRSFDYIAKNAIHYPAEGKVKQSVILFGDNTCPECKKLHQNIASMQKNGIEIFYALISRKGLSSRNSKTVDNILCSSNPTIALNDAIKGKYIPSINDCKSPQKDFLYAAINIYEIEGTPTIIDRNGERLKPSTLF